MLLNTKISHWGIEGKHVLLNIVVATCGTIADNTCGTETVSSSKISMVGNQFTLFVWMAVVFSIGMSEQFYNDADNTVNTMIVKKQFVELYNQALAKAKKEQDSKFDFENSRRRNSIFDQMSTNFATNVFSDFDHVKKTPKAEFVGYDYENYETFKGEHKHKHHHHKHSHQHENNHEHAHQHLQEHAHAHKHSAKHLHKHKHEHHHEHNHHHKHKEDHDHEEDHKHDHEHTHKHKQGGSWRREGLGSLVADRKEEHFRPASSEVKYTSFGQAEPVVYEQKEQATNFVQTLLPTEPSTFSEYQDTTYETWQQL